MEKVEALKAVENLSEDRLLSALNAPETVKESTNNFDDTESIRNEDCDADEMLKTTMPDPTKINKTIREIRKENYDENKKLRNLKLLSGSEKDHYKPVRTASAFNNNYIQSESIGDKDKNLSIKEYIQVIR